MHLFPAHLTSWNDVKIAGIKGMAGLIDVSVPISYGEFVCRRAGYSQRSIPPSISLQTLNMAGSKFRWSNAWSSEHSGNFPVFLWNIHLLRVPDDSEVCITDQALKHPGDECVGFPLRGSLTTRGHFTHLIFVCVELGFIQLIKYSRHCDHCPCDGLVTCSGCSPAFHPKSDRIGSSVRVTSDR